MPFCLKKHGASQWPACTRHKNPKSCFSGHRAALLSVLATLAKNDQVALQGSHRHASARRTFCAAASAQQKKRPQRLACEESSLPSTCYTARCRRGRPFLRRKKNALAVRVAGAFTQAQTWCVSTGGPVERDLVVFCESPTRSEPYLLPPFT